MFIANSSLIAFKPPNLNSILTVNKVEQLYLILTNSGSSFQKEIIEKNWEAFNNLLETKKMYLDAKKRIIVKSDSLHNNSSEEKVLDLKTSNQIMGFLYFNTLIL